LILTRIQIIILHVKCFYIISLFFLDSGTIIESTFEPSLARYWKKQVKAVEELGVAVIRDSDPRNDLQFLRVQTSKYEMLLSIGKKPS